MYDQYYFENMKNWITNGQLSELEFNEFERIEAKHNRIRHDVGMEEHIEVD